MPICLAVTLSPPWAPFAKTALVSSAQVRRLGPGNETVAEEACTCFGLAGELSMTAQHQVGSGTSLDRHQSQVVQVRSLGISEACIRELTERLCSPQLKRLGAASMMPAMSLLPGAGAALWLPAARSGPHRGHLDRRRGRSRLQR